MCGADCWTDHRLVVSKLYLHIQPARRPQGKKVPKKLDVSKLKQDSKRQAFINDLCSRLDALEHSSEDVDESWTVFRDTVHSSARDSLGPVSRKHQDWFYENDKEIKALLKEKHQKHKDWGCGRVGSIRPPVKYFSLTVPGRFFCLGLFLL